MLIRLLALTTILKKFFTAINSMMLNNFCACFFPKVKCIDVNPADRKKQGSHLPDSTQDWFKDNSEMILFLNN